VWLSVWGDVQVFLSMVQLMPLHPNSASSLASFKSRLVLPCWYQLTQVVVEKRPVVSVNKPVVSYHMILYCMLLIKLTLSYYKYLKFLLDLSEVHRHFDNVVVVWHLTLINYASHPLKQQHLQLLCSLKR